MSGAPLKLTLPNASETHDILAKTFLFFQTAGDLFGDPLFLAFLKEMTVLDSWFAVPLAEFANQLHAVPRNKFAIAPVNFGQDFAGSSVGVG